MAVIERFHALRQTRAHLQLFSLVDGLRYAQIAGRPLQAGPGRCALLEGTSDAALASAGPWLLDANEDDPVRAKLLATQSQVPCVSWLLAEMPLHGLAQLLQLKLDVALPGGEIGLLRFYDPRVLKSLALTLTPQQREGFFGHIVEWHFMCNGQPYRIGRADA